MKSESDFLIHGVFWYSSYSQYNLALLFSIETYESHYVNKIEGNSIDALNALIGEHGLKQSDLSEIGSQGVVSEILSGKRQLNVHQIKILGNRFKVSPAVFI